MILTIVVVIVAIVVVLMIAQAVLVPFFATFGKVYNILSTGFHILDYVAGGGVAPNSTVTQQVVQRYAEIQKQHMLGAV
jgi:hypothetical protein